MKSTFVYASHVNVPDYLVRGGVDYKLVTDVLGSVRLVVNAQTGEVAQRIDYDEFGRVLRDTAPGFQPFGFAGGLWDRDTGFVRFGARDYDAEAGRWTARDPIGFGGRQANLYVYAGSDPVGNRDPSGRFIIPLIVAACAAGGCEALGTAAIYTGALLTAGLAGGAAAYYQADIASAWDSLVSTAFSDNASEKKQLQHLSDLLGIPLKALSNELHKIKKSAGLKGESTDIDSDGTVRDKVSGEEIGNVCDE